MNIWHQLKKYSSLLFFSAVLGVAFTQIKGKEFETILPVKQVSVEGDLQRISSDSIETIILDNVEGGYFTLNLENARQRLLENPWIKRVSVRRRWPAELIVNIEEKQPVAYWNNDAYISAEGEVFAPKTLNKTLLLPKMFGPEGQHEKVWLFMNDVYKSLASIGLEVETLHMDERRAWRLYLTEQTDKAVDESIALNRSAGSKESILVRLGRYDTTERFNRFMRVFTNMDGVNLTELSKIDMRYPNGFSVLKRTTDNVEQKITMDNNKINLMKLSVENKQQLFHVNQYLNKTAIYTVEQV